jgi:hypothetical protein
MRFAFRSCTAESLEAFLVKVEDIGSPPPGGKLLDSTRRFTRAMASGLPGRASRTILAVPNGLFHMSRPGMLDYVRPREQVEAAHTPR